jgi:hypothetical protein
MMLWLQGTNTNLPVVINQGLMFSIGYPLVSYAIPTLVSVSGCAAEGNNTVECLRAGGTVVTLEGRNFGAIPPKVIIGGLSCLNVRQIGGANGAALAHR